MSNVNPGQKTPQRWGRFFYYAKKLKMFFSDYTQIIKEANILLIESVGMIIRYCRESECGVLNILQYIRRL